MEVMSWGKIHKWLVWQERTPIPDLNDEEQTMRDIPPKMCNSADCACARGCRMLHAMGD
jgi:hypothetical protein